MGLYQGAIMFTRTPFLQAIRLKDLISPLIPNLLKLYLPFYVSQSNHSGDENRVIHPSGRCGHQVPGDVFSCYTMAD